MAREKNWKKKNRTTQGKYESDLVEDKNFIFVLTQGMILFLDLDMETKIYTKSKNGENRHLLVYFK